MIRYDKSLNLPDFKQNLHIFWPKHLDLVEKKEKERIKRTDEFPTILCNTMKIIRFTSDFGKSSKPIPQ